MSEHDDAGSAVTFPPLPPPPPPHPAARSARTAAEPISAASESLLLTLPPQSPTGRVHRGPGRRGGKYRPFRPTISTGKRRYSGRDHAEVAELADAPDSKSGSLRGVWVRFPPSALSSVRSRG